MSSSFDDGYVQGGVEDAARYACAARDFMDATITISDVNAASVGEQLPLSSPFAPAVPSNSMWAPAALACDEVGQHIVEAEAALRERASRAAVDSAREAVEFGREVGIAVPPEIEGRNG
jgi:hypothetical protein